MKSLARAVGWVLACGVVLAGSLMLVLAFGLDPPVVDWEARIPREARPGAPSAADRTPPEDR